MGEPSKIQKLLFFINSFPIWWKQSRCHHDFFFEEKEKGWFTTGSLTFHVMCSKCFKDERIQMEFPPQVDKV